MRSKCPTWRWLFHVVNHFLFPPICKNKKEAHIVLVGGGSINWGGWPDYMFYEVIPVIWDFWPVYYNRIYRFIESNKVKTIIVTSYQTAELLRKRFPYKHIFAITEGIKVSLYEEGKLLVNRRIDLLEYGRQNSNLPNINLPSDKYLHIKSRKGKRLFESESMFIDALANSKVTLVFPRCITNPETAGSIETLTQRYWENMLSRVVMIGRAPQELIDLIGYNPVIEINQNCPQDQILDVIDNISDYQEFVNHNRSVALKYSSWNSRVLSIENFLTESGYSVRCDLI